MSTQRWKLGAAALAAAFFLAGCETVPNVGGGAGGLAAALGGAMGGGNNSAFTTHVVTSSFTDTYAAIAASTLSAPA